MDITNTKNGKVKWFSPDKGYGFITGEDSKDYFIHFSQIKDTGYKVLYEGDEVTFDAVETERGIQATNVEVRK